MLAVKIPRQNTIEVVNEDIPTPGEGEVLIRMKASALCRSDLYIYHGKSLFDSDSAQFTPGHEPCGIVEKLGSNVKGAKVGDRVAIYLVLSCGKCEHCLAGNWMLCSEAGFLGSTTNGAHADYLVVPEDNCMLLPPEMDFITGALATDVAGTLYTACKRLDVNGAKTVSIFGVGPMGMGGVLMAKAYGATVIAIDINDERLSLAKELGADYAVNAKNEDSVAEIRKLTRGNGADCAIVCSGVQQTMKEALESTKKLGTVGVIAESSACTIDPSNDLLRKMIEIKGCWYFNRSDWTAISEFIINKKIPLSRISTKTFSLSEAVEAFTLFDSGKTQKVVFTWN